VYADELDRIARSVLQAGPHKESVFRECCREPAHWITAGKAAEAEIVNRLTEIGTNEAGLPEANVREVIADARAHPFDPAAYADQQRERFARRRARANRPASAMGEVQRLTDEPLHHSEGPRPPMFADDALALRFAERHSDDLRFVARWSRWMTWDGRRWKEDDTLLGFDLARRICRETAVACNERKIATAIASAKTVAAVERLAKADRRIATTVDQFDRDDWLLNTPAGTIDLRTLEMHDHRPTDYITKMTAISAAGECLTWRAFLHRITDGDLDLQAFLQRMCGYALTGETREHALFFLYGLGANGKSVFLNTIAGILGDYQRTAPIETFTASTSDRHPTELAMLRGARLVTAIETEDGRRWPEARIKSLTGGDHISARFMHQDFFDFKPKFKLMIAGNHTPGLRSVDEAIRRRFNLVPFSVTIPPEERDKTLPERLRDEWSGILTWMLEGCAEWQQKGLQPPAAVVKATAEYLEAEDSIATWIEERCDRSPDLRSSPTRAI
jgi:putative DNA primase/helicase